MSAATVKKNLTVPAAKTTSERVDALRAYRKAKGLKRRELYVHDKDWPQLVKLAMKLQMRRNKKTAAAERRPQDDEAFDGMDQDG